MDSHYDIIVVGVGSMGSAACLHLSKKGKKVLGIEQFNIPHEHGSHAGQSRLIRKSYFESPGYVPLLQRSYELWDELENETSAQLFYRTGITYFGAKDDAAVEGVRASGRQFSIPIENIYYPERADQFPLFHFADDVESAWEKDAGFVLPERSISVMCEKAIRHGASFLTHTRVEDWKYVNGRFVLETSAGDFTAKKLVFTSGAWTQKILPDYTQKLRVSQQTLGWFNPFDWTRFMLNEFPCWMFTPNNSPGIFYGFPILPASDFYGPLGLKIAYHHEGRLTDPDERDASAEVGDVEILTKFVEKYLPSAGALISTKTCLYTYSEDDDFYVDHLPGYNGDVAIACGFSGHGFKFAPVIGEILSDLLLTGASNLPIEFLALDRKKH